VLFPDSPPPVSMKVRRGERRGEEGERREERGEERRGEERRGEERIFVYGERERGEERRGRRRAEQKRAEESRGEQRRRQEERRGERKQTKEGKGEEKAGKATKGDERRGEERRRKERRGRERKEKSEKNQEGGVLSHGQDISYLSSIVVLFFCYDLSPPLTPPHRPHRKPLPSKEVCCCWLLSSFVSQSGFNKPKFITRSEFSPDTFAANLKKPHTFHWFKMTHNCYLIRSLRSFQCWKG